MAAAAAATPVKAGPTTILYEVTTFQAKSVADNHEYLQARKSFLRSSLLGALQTVAKLTPAATSVTDAELARLARYVTVKRMLSRGLWFCAEEDDYIRVATKMVDDEHVHPTDPKGPDHFESDVGHDFYRRYLRNVVNHASIRVLLDAKLGQNVAACEGEEFDDDDGKADTEGKTEATEMTAMTPG
jgi:hypothetical protein